MGGEILSIKIVHENCNLNLAKDKSLPTNSYLVTYELDGKVLYDIVISNKRSDIFDAYWDKYRNDLKTICWTDGKFNSKMWGYKTKEDKRRK